VADRFHLLKNLGDALADLLSRLYPELSRLSEEPPVSTAEGRSVPDLSPPARPMTVIETKTLLSIETAAAPAASGSAPNSAPHRQAQQRALELKEAHRTTRLARYEEVVRLHQLGWSQRAIGQRLGLSGKTIRRWLSQGAFPEYRYPAVRSSKLDGYKPYLDQRFAEGCHNARQLWVELRAQGSSGGCPMVREYLAGLRETSRQEQGTADGRQHGGKLPRPGQLKWLLLRPISEVDDAQYQLIPKLCHSSKEVTLAYGLVMHFQELVRSRQADQLSSWVEVALASGVAEMVGFAREVPRDFAAVLAGLEVEWSHERIAYCTSSPRL
jgi:transposase